MMMKKVSALKALPSCSSRAVHTYETRVRYDPHMSLGIKYGEVLKVRKSGADVINDPLYNKGSGFGLEERERLHVRGLVPPRIFSSNTLETQSARVMNMFNSQKTPLDKYNYITSLQDRNETLFYKTLTDHLEQMAPIIYTPTVGAACQQYAHIFRRPRGMYYSLLDAGHMHAMAHNWPSDDVRVIVVTDGSRILGLGDLGTNGMGIPIGKLSLYTAAAGIHPARCLPVVIDVGTNNEKLLNDPLYLGLQRKRATGSELHAVVDEFVKAVTERWPKVFIQFEDFSNDNAVSLLEQYQQRVLCFNDDIQGTGCVALAGVLAALRAVNISQGRSSQSAASSLSAQRYLVCGAGSAGVGVANSIFYAMTHGHGAISKQRAAAQFTFTDNRGALGAGRRATNAQQARYIREDIADCTPLAELVKRVKPTVLIGLTGVGGLWNEQIIKEMAKHCQRPIIFALSNPTANSECTAEQAYAWTGGRAIFASGSPFAPVTVQGRTHLTSQANNMFTFPAIGLAALCCVPTVISSKMLNKASRTLAQAVSPHDLASGKLFPPLSDIRRVSEEIAFEICATAYDEQLATEPHPGSASALRQLIRSNMWEPHYAQLVPVRS